MRVSFLLVAVLIAASPHALADESPPAAAREGMPVKVANRQIIVLRGPVAGYSARERATGAMERIERALDANPAAAVSLAEAPEGTRVMVGGQHAFLVTKIDIDPLAGETTQIVAKYAAERLEHALVERREQSSPRYTAWALAYAAAATTICAGLLWLLWFVYSWLRQRLAGSAARHSGRLSVGGVRVLSARQLLWLTSRLVALALWTATAALLSVWLAFVLERFPYTRPWGEQLLHYLLRFLEDVAVSIVAAMPGLLFAAVIALVARAVQRATGVFFDIAERGERSFGWINRDTAQPTRRIFGFIVWVFALAIAYPYLPGAQTEAFKGLSVLLGLMVSLGAASLVGQAFSGLILMYSGAYRSGDFVRIGETEGTVQSLGTFVTQLRTGQGEELTLPNSVVMSATVRNLSRAGPATGSLVEAGVTIGYSTPWRQVHAMLAEAARRTPEISAIPAPFVRQAALSDFYVDYRLVIHTPAPDGRQRMDVLSRLHANIQDVFNENGVQIMSPHYLGDPAEPQVVPKERWYAPPAKGPDRP